MGAVYVDRIPFSRRIGGMLNVGLTNSIITNTLVNANNTVTLLKAAITAALVRPDDTPIAVGVNKALDKGITLGLWAESHGFTTVAGLVAATDASAAFRQGLRG